LEAGLDEEEAINSLGSIETIINEIKINIVSKRSDEKKTNTLKNFLIILGICSTPILLPLGITFTVLFFVMFIVLFSLILSFGLSGITVIGAGIVQSIISFATGEEVFVGLIQLGVSLIIGPMLLILTMYVFKLTQYLLNGTIKSFARLVGKKSKKGS